MKQKIWEGFETILECFQGTFAAAEFDDDDDNDGDEDNGYDNGGGDYDGDDNGDELIGAL